jgi:hypothetical protein
LIAFFLDENNMAGGTCRHYFVGCLTVLIRKQPYGSVTFFEKIPGCILSLPAIYGVSKMTPPPAESITKVFDETERIMNETGN